MTSSRVMVLRAIAAACVCLLLASSGYAADRAAGRRIVNQSGVRGGLVVHVGCGNGRLTAGLHGGDRYVVQGLDTDREEVQAAREHLRSRGLLGGVSIRRWSGGRLPYVDNLVDLLVVEEPGAVPEGEMMRVLSPRGVAMVRHNGGWTRRAKEWPAEIDEWTHWLHGPDGNAVSSDERVGVSRSLQWTMPPRWSRHHNLPAGFNALVSADGRVYYLVDEAPNATYGPARWVLVARDAFNGLVQWRRPMEAWGMEAWDAPKRLGSRVGRFHGSPDFQAPRRILAEDDRVFVTPGFHAPVTMLEGPTGRPLRTYPQTKNTGEMLYRDGTLYVARNTYGEEPGKSIMAVDVRTGDTLWDSTGYSGVTVAHDYQAQHTSAYMVLGREHVFFVDDDRVVALDADTGRQAWTKPVPFQEDVLGDIRYFYNNLCTLVYRDGMLYFAQLHPGTGHMQGEWQMKKLSIQARNPRTGELKWEHTGGSVAHVTSPDLFVTGGKVWTLDPSLPAKGDRDARLLGLDRLSGKTAVTHHLENITHGHHHRCYRNKATSRYMLMGEEGIEYIDFDSGAKDIHYWVRGACRYGIMPANGFIYLTPHNCSCYLGTLLRGFKALKSGPTPATGGAPAERLVKGDAYDADIDDAAAAAEDDWPTFRRDNMRSCSAPVDLPDELTMRWNAAPGGELTAPIAVGDRVFVASTDRHMVSCLDTDTGEVSWRFVADGPVNTPPTYWKGRLLFGTRSGSLYSISADDGSLAWKRRVAPGNSQLMAFGRLESPWPLNGSPLVMDGSVYCVAGRSMHLDSGIEVARVDAESGRLLQRTNLQADTEPKGEVQGAVLPDILVGNGKDVYMKWMRFGADDITRHEVAGRVARHGGPNKPDDILACATDMTDDSWHNTCFWSYRGFRAQQMAFDGGLICGASGPERIGWGGAFGHDVHRPGDGYTVRQWRFDNGKRTREWRTDVPLRPSALVLTKNSLCLAGAPDEKGSDGLWGALQGRKAALLQVISRETGDRQARHRLAAPPVYNGMAAAGDRLYISLENGTLVCLGARKRTASNRP